MLSCSQPQKGTKKQHPIPGVASRAGLSVLQGAGIGGNLQYSSTSMAIRRSRSSAALESESDYDPSNDDDESVS